jgi:hypothetical protein
MTISTMSKSRAAKETIKLAGSKNMYGTHIEEKVKCK